MKSIIISIYMAIIASIATSSTILSSSGNQDSYGVVIYNHPDNKAVVVGSIDYSNPSLAVVDKLTIPDFYYETSDYQLGSFNYNENTLTFVVLEFGVNSPYLATVNCTSWTLLTNVRIQRIAYGGIEYYQTPTNINLLYTTTTIGELINLNIMVPDSGDYLVADIIPYATLSTTGYDPNEHTFYCTFKNSSGVLLTRTYSNNGNFLLEKEVSFSNTNLDVVGGPTKMFYNQNSKNPSLMANVVLKDSESNVYGSLAYLNWATGTFQVTNMATHAGFTITTSVADVYNKDLVYIIGHIQNQYYLYTFSQSSNSGLSVSPINTPILSAF